VGIVFVSARSIPEAWELSLVKLKEVGRIVDTEYGERSIDAPAVIIVEEPLSEPRIHIKGLVGNLFEYVREVLEGVNDRFVEEGKVEYTYHERLFSYRLPDGRVVNQVEKAIEKLRKAPYTRRAQAITWQPWKDLETDHPPCLQRIWFRVVDGRLVTHVHMRSNDAFKAAFMNMYAFTELQRYVAQRLRVEVGYYMHIADSYHVYERDWKWFTAFVEQAKRGESKKYWRTTEEYSKLLSHKNAASQLI